MARTARLESPTNYYHVMARGNNREGIFNKTTEKKYFMELLQHQIEDNRILVVAYCLMGNHVHLLIHSNLQEMSDALKWVNIKFAGRYNYKYKRDGHVFQDRFKSEVIDTEEYLIQAIRYIHNNPVKANITSKASAYEWSSYNSYIGNKNVLIDAGERQKILELFSGSIEQFETFHLNEETREFLEIKEDLEKERDEKAQNIINKHLQQNGLVRTGELDIERGVLEEIILDLVKKCHLSHRRIAELLGLSRGVVHGVARKI